jgi:hypothetical protein
VTVNHERHQSPFPRALNTRGVSTMAGQADDRRRGREIARSRGPETGSRNDGTGRLEHNVHHLQCCIRGPNEAPPSADGQSASNLADDRRVFTRCWRKVSVSLSGGFVWDASHISSLTLSPRFSGESARSCKRPSAKQDLPRRSIPPYIMTYFLPKPYG